MTIEEKIRICNAINLSVTKGWKVLVDQDCGCPYSVNGAIIHEGLLIGITPYGNSPIDSKRRIFTAKEILVEIEEIYKPPLNPVDNSSSNSGACDSRNSNPRSAAKRAKTATKTVKDM